MTHTNFNRKELEINEIEKSIPRSQVTRIIDGDHELKNIAGQVLTYNSKNFH